MCNAYRLLYNATHTLLTRYRKYLVSAVPQTPFNYCFQSGTPRWTLSCFSNTAGQFNWTEVSNRPLRSTAHLIVHGMPRGTRTLDLLLRRQLLYPSELLAHIKSIVFNSFNLHYIILQCLYFRLKLNN